MGIPGLEKFIRTSDQNIAQKIDIRKEISKWRREHGKDPVILIDSKELVKVLNTVDNDGVTVGGRYHKINEIIDFFFAEITNCHGKLVFIERLQDRFRCYDQFLPMTHIYDFVARYQHLKTPSNENVTSFALRPYERAMYNLSIICKQYGKVISTYGLQKCAILAYVKEHRDAVMALITRNTEYFIHKMDCDFWSLSCVEYNKLKIARFDRQKLNEALGLNQQQMQLLYAISKVRPFENTRTGGFLGIIGIVKKQVCGSNGYDLSKLSGISCNEDQREQMQEYIDQLKKTDSFDGSYKSDEYNELVSELMKEDPEFKVFLQYCKENNHFAYELINDTRSGLNDLLFIDVSQPDSACFINLTVYVQQKMIGIVFKDITPEKRPKKRIIQTKRTLEKAKYEMNEMDIVYPTEDFPEDFPSLYELMVQEDNADFADSKWALLQWLLALDAETISDIRKSPESEFIRVVSLTLKFLLSHKIITIQDNEVILRTEKQHETKNSCVSSRFSRQPPPMPRSRYADHIEVAWIQTAHKYTIAFYLICHCLEICGLRSETVLIQFDAFEFHANMREMARNERGLLDRVARIQL